MARGVTCRECGCLNFSSEHEVCDKCRSQTLMFRPTARRLAASTLNARRSEDSDGRAHSSGKKRRVENASNKKQEDRETREKPKKQPDVIDLISDDDDDEEDNVVLQQVTREILSTTRREEEEEEENEANEPRALFQSRVFSTVAFAARDFPSMEEGTQMRKKAANMRLPHSQPTGRKAAITAGGRGQEKPTAAVPQAAEKTVDPRPAEARPPPASVEDDKEKTAVTVTPHTKKDEKAGGTDSSNKQGEKVAAPVPAAPPSTASAVEGMGSKQPEEKVKEEDPLVHSRVFDAIEFKASDFATVFDGLAVARRSHPPASSSATSTYVGPVAIAPTVPTSPKANEVPGPARAATVASTTTPAPSSTTTKTTSEAKATGAPAESAACKVPTKTAPAPAPAQSSATPPSTTTLQSVSKAPATSAQPVSAKPTLTPATATPPITAPSTQSSSAAVTPPTKATPTLIRPSSAPGSSVKPVVSQTTLSKSSPAPVPPKSASATPVSMVMKSTSTTIPGTKPAAATAATAATKASSTLATNSNQTQVNGSANVLLPKKKHPEGIKRADEEKRHTKPPPIDVNTSADADGVEFVKVNAAPLEVLPVEAPVLGYCSPEFLAFMRECGDEDGDEDDDPEEVSRSQLELLDVVDLTNLSDSEDSDAESPLPTPRDGALLKSLPANAQAAAAVGQSTATANVSGTGTWYVPTLESERKRTQPEKVMCELCEEKGSSYRLIRCPTCTKYYHKKCAKENGDENICWNCELGSLIDDSELDEEHAKHNSEYLAYLKAIRRSSPSPEDGEDDQEEGDDENEDQVGEEGEGEEDVEMKSPAEGGEGTNPFSEGGNKHSRRWREFVGDATGDIDASYLEVTNRIAEELRDEEKRRIYSRGFVSREEFEAQMTEVEEYFISEEARLQQLEREKALEAKKAADARKIEEQASNGGQLADSSASGNNAASVPASVVQDGANAGGAVNNAVAQPSATTPVAPPPSAVNAPTTATTAPMAVPIATHSTAPHRVVPTTARTAVPVPALVPVPTAAFAAAFWAAFATPPSKP